MNRVRRNVVANLLGKGWNAGSAFLFTPLYIKLLGIEAYGIIVLFVNLQGSLTAFDFGLSTSFNREMAALPSTDRSSRWELLRAFETAHWLIALVGLLVSLPIAWSVGNFWMDPGHMTRATLVLRLALLGGAIFLQLPSLLYMAGLNGLQRQVTTNLVLGASATLRCVGASAMMLWVARDLTMFLECQLVASVLQTVGSRLALVAALGPAASRPPLRWSLIWQSSGFTAQLAGVSLMSLLIVQLDKLWLIRVVPLESFGYYGLAWMMASGLYFLINAGFDATYPRFSELVAHGPADELRATFMRSCEWLSALVLPVGAVLVTWSSPLVWLWTRNPAVAREAGSIASLLTLGVTLHSFGFLPYALQLANRRAEWAFRAHWLALLLFLPVSAALSSRFGGQGAAVAWVLLQIAWQALWTARANHRLMPGEERHWYWHVVFVPLTTAFVAAGLTRWLWPVTNSALVMALGLCVSGLSSLAATLLATPTSRGLISVLAQRYARARS